MRHAIAALAPIVLVAGAAHAAPIAVGAKLPALSVKDSEGRARTLASAAGRNGAVLVLFRSAKWCPYCQTQLKELKGVQADLAKRGVGLAALSYDAPAVLAGFAERQDIGYTLLSDEQSRAIDALGLRDAAYKPGHFAHGVPTATILVIDAGGVVRARMSAQDYKVRAGNQAILAAVDRLPRR